ncbi:2OG-Fe dioxygenase family protein [Allonocardiopsis opalescens]|uniref:2OG-Fe dioxygenase family protein n=1 Tax=Allonocardiopsis opalescens TaxID=1144618 RepID=UPI0014730DEF|nr:2OG-Fe dioxygenase family protein [Allonocardiopsis opalescens]
MTDVARGIAAYGFLLVDGPAFRPDQACMLALDAFSQTWRDLPPDDYLPGNASYRLRRHARFILNPDSGRLQWVQDAGYFQHPTVNPLTGGIVRRFAPLLDGQARNPFLQALILRNASIFSACTHAMPAAWEIDVHLIRITARPGVPGRPSPEGKHRDGFDYIALHHIGRENVTGGCTKIYDIEGALLKFRTFTGRLDSLYADDSRILHDVTPVVLGPDGPTGHRDMLLMSFTGLSNS